MSKHVLSYVISCSGNFLSHPVRAVVRWFSGCGHHEDKAALPGEVLVGTYPDLEVVIN
jgi:hypothetical protein